MGAAFSGYLGNKIGGPASPYCLPIAITCGIIATIFGAPIPFVSDPNVFYILLWIYLFFGGCMTPLMTCDDKLCRTWNESQCKRSGKSFLQSVWLSSRTFRVWSYHLIHRRWRLKRRPDSDILSKYSCCNSNYRSSLLQAGPEKFLVREEVKTDWIIYDQIGIIRDGRYKKQIQ